MVSMHTTDSLEPCCCTINEPSQPAARLHSVCQGNIQEDECLTEAVEQEFPANGCNVTLCMVSHCTNVCLYVNSMHSAGCTLPVEMFFPEEEYPSEAVEQELQQLGVMCSVLPDLVPAYAVKNSSNMLTDTEGKRLAGFSMKSAAVLLSSFEEVSLPVCLHAA